ncbi:hypothetical protein ACFPYJ_03025 [Paenibacillus solisilvae]|uniref:Uncharacterized protein n=1 Tax=Paenibacillus solisilvae TaxID=2486751 RepID=A0ABW0VV84_9BACL
MAPLIALLVSFLFFRVLGLAGWTHHMDDWHTSLQGAVAAMFLLTATAHWGNKRKDLIRMVPAALPRADWRQTDTDFVHPNPIAIYFHSGCSLGRVDKSLQA